MGIRKDEKLKWLQQQIPEGVAIPSTWLSANGYNPQLVRKYVQSGWLNAVGSRVYARPGEPVTWEGVVLGLQKLAQLRLHIGGVSALNRQGLAHYLSLSGDASARPSVVNALLRSCVHNKAKRLFLFLANHYAYPWTKRIDLDAIDLGRGKRLVTRGGRLDKHYQITVPDAFHAKPK